MKVSLIDYTGRGSADRYYAARLLAYTKNTRLQQGAATAGAFAEMSDQHLLAELDYIAKTIRSSWEFVAFTFQIEDVTRAFTHQLVRTRTGSYAQQSQRSVNMEDFSAEMPASLDTHKKQHEWKCAIEDIQQAYKNLHEMGVPTQDCRGLLPTNVHTNIIAQFNLRTLSDLVAKRSNPRAQGEYERVVNEMERLVLEVMPWTKGFLRPERTRTPALDKLLRKALGGATPADVPEVNSVLKEVDMLKATWG
jgi:flavin-dependent thymidylate synthase